MGRVRLVLFAPLLASVTSLLLAACAAARAPAPVHAGRGPCAATGSRTLAADRSARVFSLHGSVYGCDEATGKRRRLGGAGVCRLAGGVAGPVSLAGTLVAYGLETCGVDTKSATATVRDLASGKRVVTLDAAALPLKPESFVSVASIVVRRDGAVGWIAGVASIVGGGRETFEVHRFQRGKSSVLDAGAGVAPASLRVVGSRMRWRDGGATRSASLA